MNEFRFNVLNDPWVPLLSDRSVEYVSYADLLCGRADAEELSSPREDIRFFGRMLLSVLTQALFIPTDAQELAERMAKPLDRKTAEAAISGVLSDFELVGKGAFMQDDTCSGNENETERLFLDLPSGTNHTLFRPAYSHTGLCAACAVPAVYGLQSFAAAGGRGFSPGVRFRPPVTTLVWRRSAREMIWANVLSLQQISSIGYTADPKRAWSLAPQLKAGETIGLLEGLFWKPRRFKLEPCEGHGPCSVCGRTGPLLAVKGFAPGSKVNGGFFRHPFSPSREDIKAGQVKKRFVHFRTDRPAWTGLAELLPAVGGGGGGLAAPVVEQWLEALGHREVTLQILAYISAQAKILARVSESFSVSMQNSSRAVAEDVAFLIERADRVLGELRKALRNATQMRGSGDLWLPDAEAAYWQETESPFWASVELSQAGQDPSLVFSRQLRTTAMRIFDKHTEAACLSETKQRPIAMARLRLKWSLARILTTEVNNAGAQAV
jgi:CRISPR type I-E-associated protein CasA/Cse1